MYILPLVSGVAAHPGQLISITLVSIITASSNGRMLTMSASAEAISGGMRNDWERPNRAVMAPAEAKRMIVCLVGRMPGR